MKIIIIIMKKQIISKIALLPQWESFNVIGQTKVMLLYVIFWLRHGNNTKKKKRIFIIQIYRRTDSMSLL